MYKCKYCGKEFDNQRALAGHSSWCDKNPSHRSKDTLKESRKNAVSGVLKNKGKEVACQYCGKICKLYGVKNHEKYCKENPNRFADKRNVSKFKNGTYVAWNKGLTKDTDERVAKYASTIKDNFDSGKTKVWCDGLTKETDIRIANYANSSSQTINNKVANDE